MRTTIAIMILVVFMANKVKSEEITMSYQLIIYDKSKPLFWETYNTLEMCLKVGNGFATYTCTPVVKKFAQ